MSFKKNNTRLSVQSDSQHDRRFKQQHNTTDSTYNVQTDEEPTVLSVLTVMLWIQVLCDVTLRRHFIRLLYPEDEAIGNLQTPHIT
jgi:hypothetical protein